MTNDDTTRSTEEDTGGVGLRRRSFRANFSWIFAGKVFYTAARFLMYLMLVRLGGAAAAGLWAVGQAVCLPVIRLTGLNLRMALVTDARNEYTYGHYIGLRLMTGCLAVLIITGAVIFPWYDRDIEGETGRNNWEMMAVIMLLGVGHTIMGMREMMLGIMIKNECMNLAARSGFILSTVALVGFVGSLYLTRNLVVAIAVLVSVRIAVMLLHDLPTARAVARTFKHEVAVASLKPNLSFRMLRRLCISALPLGLALTLAALTNSIPVYYLKRFHGEKACGYYGTIVALIAMSMSLLETMGMAVSPRLARYFWENRPAFVRMLWKLVRVAMGIGVVAFGATWLLGEWMLRVFFQPDFADYAPHLILLTGSFGPLLVVYFLVGALTAARGFLHLLCSFVIIVTACAIAAKLLIAPYGVWGAVGTSLVSITVSLVVLSLALVIRIKTTKPISQQFSEGEQSGQVIQVETTDG